MKYLPLWLLLVTACSSTQSPRQPPTEAPPAPSPAATVQLTPPAGEPFLSSPACSNDDTCGWARCDSATKRCAFPCTSDAECNHDAKCLPSPGNQEILVCAIPLDAP